MDTAAHTNNKNFLDIKSASLNEWPRQALSSLGQERLVLGFRYIKAQAESAKIGHQWLEVADTLHATRQFDKLNRISRLILSLPAPKQITSSGLYYQALCEINLGAGNYERALPILDAVTSNAPPLYRTRAVLSYGSIVRSTASNPQDALPLYNEALRRASYHESVDIYTLLGANRMIAILRSLDGDSKCAVKILEHLLPIAEISRRIRPHLYYDLLNSLAFEKGQTGRVREGLEISNVVASSPYSRFYPEWRATNDELSNMLSTRQQVSVKIPEPDPKTKNSIPQPEHQSIELKATQMVSAEVSLLLPLYARPHGWHEISEVEQDALVDAETVRLLIKIRWDDIWYEVCNDPIYGNIRKTIRTLRKLLVRIMRAGAASLARVRIRTQGTTTNLFEGSVTSSGVTRLLRFIQRISENPMQ
jgi:hypothetical protein